MDEKLLFIIGGAFTTLLALIVWIVKRLFKANETNTERSFKAIENNTDALHEIKRILEGK